MLITNGTIVTPGMRRRTINRQVSLGPVSLRIVTLVVIAASALIALAQSTQSATKNYTEQGLKSEVSKKASEIEAMRFEATRLQSLQAITNSQPSPSPSTSLEQPKQINYLPGSANNDLSQVPDSALDR